MAITRRKFLKSSALASAGAMFGPSLFGNPFVRRAFADTIGDRYLVIFFLDGGNDGLNTVIPINDVGGLRTGYEDARKSGGGGGLRITSGEMVVPATSFSDPGTGTTLGFHPGLANLSTMYDAGRVAVIQGAGYPDYNLSHDESASIWMTGNPAGVPALGGTGWAGRHLALEYGSSQIPAVALASSIPGELAQNGTSVLAIDNLADFGFPFDDWEPEEDPKVSAAYYDMYTAASGSSQPAAASLGTAGLATQAGTINYPQLDGLYNTDRGGWSAMYDALDTGPASDLREIAKMIYGNANSVAGIDARFFQLTDGGYDTHSNQGGADPNGWHYSLLAGIGDAVKLFFDDLRDMGVAHKTTMVIWSEFGRRVPQNANGTDHGSQAPMFVIGDSVTGGVYGDHPNVADSALDDSGNTPYSQAAGSFRSTDFRDVYGTLLKHWVNMSEASILADVLPLDTGPADEYWTVQNFDLGFV